MTDAPFTDSHAIGRGWLRLHRVDTPRGEYSHGDFVDRRGFVSIYRQDGLTRLDMVVAGKLVMRTWKRWLPDRTVSRYSREMLNEHAPAPDRLQGEDVGV